MFKGSFAIVAATAVLLAGCSTDGGSQAQMVSPAGAQAGATHGAAHAAQQGQTLALRPVAASTQSRIDAPRQVVVRDSAAWQRLWAEHIGSDAALPAVDFSRELVVGVFRGTQPNGCYTTAIDRVTRQGDRLTVHQVDRNPAADAICTMMMVAPVQLVAVTRAEAGAATDVAFSKDPAPLR